MKKYFISFMLVVALLTAPISTTFANTTQQSHDALVQQLISLLLLRIQELQTQLATLQEKEANESLEVEKVEDESPDEDKEEVTESVVPGDTKKEKEMWQAIYDYEDRHDLSGQVVDSVKSIEELDSGLIQIKAYGGSTITTDISEMDYYKDWDELIAKIK